MNKVQMGLSHSLRTLRSQAVMQDYYSKQGTLAWLGTRYVSVGVCIRVKPAQAPVQSMRRWA